MSSLFQQRKVVAILIGLVLSVSCQPTPSPESLLQGAGEEVLGSNSVDGTDRQAGVIAAISSLIPTLLTPLLGNFGTSIVNALTATLLGRELALISPHGVPEPIGIGPVREPFPSRG